MYTFNLLWGALKKKFHVGGQINQTTRYIELIAMLIFWWIYDHELQSRSNLQITRFMGDFDILGEK